MSVKQVLENIDLLSLILSFRVCRRARRASRDHMEPRMEYNQRHAARLTALTGPHPNPTQQRHPHNSGGSISMMHDPRLVTRRMRRRLVGAVYTLVEGDDIYTLSASSSTTDTLLHKYTFCAGEARLVGERWIRPRSPACSRSAPSHLRHRFKNL